MVQQVSSTQEKSLTEISVKVIFLSIILALLLAASNAYLALKVGILTSASIPAAILSMGILRFFKGSTILENNLVQTCASTGEAVAGGIVYTIPALIIIHYWTHFPYWQTALISMLGGILGVLFSVPLRRVLINEPSLRFPEGRAIAAVLLTSEENAKGLSSMLIGGGLGAVIELAQSGFKILADSLQWWTRSSNTIFGGGVGFSATLIGAGYLVGFNVGLSLLLGAIIGWCICIPSLTSLHPLTIGPEGIVPAVMNLWSNQVRYIGIGAMLVAGVWTLLNLLGPIISNIKLSWRTIKSGQVATSIKPTDSDIPIIYVFLGIVLVLLALMVLFHYSFPWINLALATHLQFPFTLATVFYVLVVGFLLCLVCAYFSGMVGVTASPGSSAIILGMIVAAALLRLFFTWHLHGEMGTTKIYAAAVTIIIGAVITAAAAIANDNIQDLKVGQLVGATPWKQQMMLILGVIVGSLIIPPVIENLFNVYGIGGVFPHPGMDPTQVLPAPPAALMAAVTKAVFDHNMPWTMFAIGALIAGAAIILNAVLKNFNVQLSVIGIAMGIYLPLTSSTPLFIGALLSWLINKKLTALKNSKEQTAREHLGTLIACGLVAGAALMDILLSIPFGMMGNPDVLKVVPAAWGTTGTVLSIIVTILLCKYIYHRVCRAKV